MPVKQKLPAASNAVGSMRINNSDTFNFLKKEIEKAFGKEGPEDLKREEYERALKIIREYEKEKNGGK